MSGKGDVSESVEAKLARLEAAQSETEKKLKGFKGQLGVVRSQLGLKGAYPAADKPKEAASVESQAETSVKEAPTLHFLRPFEKVCADCGEPNPMWKDETICRDKEGGGCGMHLGALLELKKVKACPNCGATKFQALRKLTEEERKIFA